MDIFLQAGQVLKSLNQRVIERDREGNPIVWIEASNPNPDIENEKLYAQTLLDAQGYFLSYGNITYDHLPKSAPHTGSVGYIGKPLAVQQKGNSVWVKCKLNRSNPIVKQAFCGCCRFRWGQNTARQLFVGRGSHYLHSGQRHFARH